MKATIIAGMIVFGMAGTACAQVAPPWGIEHLEYTSPSNGTMACELTSKTEYQCDEDVVDDNGCVYSVYGVIGKSLTLAPEAGMNYLCQPQQLVNVELYQAHETKANYTALVTNDSLGVQDDCWPSVTGDVTFAYLEGNNPDVSLRPFLLDLHLTAAWYGACAPAASDSQ